MAKNKDFQQWMNGAVWALNIVKEHGIQRLEKEIKMRGIYKVHFLITYEDVEEAHSFIGNNVYQTVISTVIWTLREWLGYGKKKLHDFKDLYDKYALDLIDLNWHGEHYVDFEDRALELNREFGFNFDLARLSVLREEDDKKNPEYRKMDLEETCDFLRREGYEEAAECLQKKVEWLRA